MERLWRDVASRSRLVFAAVAAVLLSSPAAAGLVVNGDFEADAIGRANYRYVVPSGWNSSDSVNGPVVTGWDSTSWGGTGTRLPFAGGNYFLGLQTNNVPAPRCIFQDVQLSVSASSVVVSLWARRRPPLYTNTFGATYLTVSFGDSVNFTQYVDA